MSGESADRFFDFKENTSRELPIQAQQHYALQEYIIERLCFV